MSMIQGMPLEDWREGLAPGATKRIPYTVPDDGGSELVAGFQPAPMFAHASMHPVHLFVQSVRLWSARPYTNPPSEAVRLIGV